MLHGQHRLQRVNSRMYLLHGRPTRRRQGLYTSNHRSNNKTASPIQRWPEPTTGTESLPRSKSTYNLLENMVDDSFEGVRSSASTAAAEQFNGHADQDPRRWMIRLERSLQKQQLETDLYFILPAEIMFGKGRLSGMQRQTMLLESREV